MAIYNIFKKIYDLLNTTAGMTHAGLVYGSSDGGTNWYPIKVDASGIVSVTFS